MMQFKKMSIVVCLLVSFTQMQSYVQVYFSAKHSLRTLFEDLIAHEQKSIKVAMYMFSDKGIAQALADARARGVQVEVVVDQTSLSHAIWRNGLLQDAGVACYGFITQGFSPLQDPLMHHKFMLFASNTWPNGYYLNSIFVTGSANLSAKVLQQKNFENVLVGVAEHAAFKGYVEEFASLKLCEQVVKLP